MFAIVTSSGFFRRLVGLCVKSYGWIEYASSFSGPPVHFLSAPWIRFSFLFTHTILRMNSSGGVEMPGWKWGAISPITTSASGSAPLIAL